MKVELNLPTVISIVSLFIAVSSLIVAGRVAWINYFKPAKIIGTFPHLTIWTLSKWKDNSPTGEIRSRHITPSFWIGNTGAKDILVEDIRMVFKPSDGRNIIAYPTNHVPISAVESPSEFNDYESLNLGGPFFGFSLKRSEGWKSYYSYATSEEGFQKLKGDVIVEIQVSVKSKENWRTVITEVFEFGSHPIHLQGLVSFSHPAGSLMNYVQSKSWKQRRHE